jgi:hypothetical protein
MVLRGQGEMVFKLQSVKDGLFGEEDQHCEQLDNVISSPCLIFDADDPHSRPSRGGRREKHESNIAEGVILRC